MCDQASERALEVSAALMEKFDEATRVRELLGGMAGVQSSGEYAAIKRTLDARANALIEAANLVEHHFGVSRHAHAGCPDASKSPREGSVAATRDLTTTLDPGQAVALYLLVAQSNFSNGLGALYAQLGDLVRDEDGHVPSSTTYQGPTWA